MPTWVPAATADTWLGGEFKPAVALAKMPAEQRSEIAAAAVAADNLRRPMNHERLVQRLTALGMVMAPNRPPAEASMWVREMARLLSDIADDVLCAAIDTVQKRMKFLPTVAEIRELADPVMEQRRKQFFRLDTMRRFIESGQAIPLPTPRKSPPMERRGEPMTEAECAIVNENLERLGACSRYRADGSRYEVSKRPAKKHMAERSEVPTRQDYIDMGVDPAVLDKIAAEKAA